MKLFDLRRKLCSFSEERNQWRYSLIGPEGLDNIEFLLRDCVEHGVKGDFVETGVWQGGACIYARAVLDEIAPEREVWACDSFQGLPPPTWKEDEGDKHHTQGYLKVTIEEVQDNFKRCEVPDDGVTFVRGWFKDTMPIIKDKLENVAILRLDGDMYESTMVVLDNLYDKVSKGGYVIIDDYCLPSAIAATNDFRKKRNITAPMVKVNSCIYYWRC